jgi:hypothetical protein
MERRFQSFDGDEWVVISSDDQLLLNDDMSIMVFDTQEEAKAYIDKSNIDKTCSPALVSDLANRRIH